MSLGAARLARVTQQDGSAHRMFVWLKAGDTPLRTAFQCALVCLLENIVGKFFRLLICTQARRAWLTAVLKLVSSIAKQALLARNVKKAHKVEARVNCLNALLHLFAARQHSVHQQRVGHHYHLHRARQRCCAVDKGQPLCVSPGALWCQPAGCDTGLQTLLPSAAAPCGGRSFG